MKNRVTTLKGLFKRKIDVTNLEHGSTGFYSTFIVLTVPFMPTMPSIRALNHPVCATGVNPFVPAGRIVMSRPFGQESITASIHSADPASVLAPAAIADISAPVPAPGHCAVCGIRVLPHPSYARMGEGW
jgi:hypothetical protein